MSKWKIVALAEVAEIERNSVQASAIRDGTLYVGLENIQSGGDFLNVREVDEGELASSKFAFSEDHLLFGKLRPYLAKIARPTFAGVCSTDILPIKPGPLISRDYLSHFLRQPDLVDLANARASGANLPRLSPRVLASFELPLPPLPEQRRIAAILDQAETLRIQRRAALAQLDSLTQSLFLDMFGDPVTNPKGWPLARLDQLVRPDDTINYGVVQPGDALDEGVPLVRVGDIVDENLKAQSLKRIDPKIESAYRRSRLKGDEVLVTCVGSIGVVALANAEMKGFNIARAVARVPLSNEVDRTFIASYLRTDFVQRYFTAELRTVSQPTLNIKQICETKVIQPPFPIQQTFATRVQTIEALKAKHRAALAELDALFASLQHRAFSGML